MLNLPKIGEKLSVEQVNLLRLFRKSCSHTIISMVKQSQSGHPGGSLSALDFLVLAYCFIIGQQGNQVVVSNGHISPAVYSVLAEMKYIDKQAVIDTFRKIGSVYEGHVTRHVPGIWYGTGPLGVGASAATGMAMAEKLKHQNEKVFLVVGDGECQEGQVYEAMNFAKHYQLDNLIAFMDYNQVQLTASLKDIADVDFEAMFKAGGWEVINVDGHNFEEMWAAIGQAYQTKGKPVMIIGHTIMGKGVDFMEETGVNHQADWHGKAPKPDQADEVLAKIAITNEEQKLIDQFVEHKVTWQPSEPDFTENLAPIEGFNSGEPIVYEAGTPIDCRTGYGKALLDLAQKNQKVVAVSADLRGSVMTKFVAAELPDQHVEVGIAEQNMVSLSGGMSLSGLIPFCSTFGAFMSSRAKDQARVNDINHCNVKMVATHCGLSVGEDGPTHQAIDDMGSFLGFFGTMIVEPADANQCDRIIRYAAGHYGNFYVRMGRHKFEPITKEDGSLFYGPDYQYEYGKSDVIRAGHDITIAASGALVSEALKARQSLIETGFTGSIEVVAVSSIKEFDQTLLNSIKKTQKVITVEDHNTKSGLGGMLARKLMEAGIQVDQFKMMGVEEYQLSGTWKDLYQAAGISAEHIAEACKNMT